MLKALKGRIWDGRDGGALGFGHGLKDGMPVSLGYFAVGIAFGTLAVSYGLSPELALLISVTNLTSAGQFVKATGQDNGINSGNIWDVDTQINALIDHYIYNRNYANNKGWGEEYIYALHHDGPSLKNGGLGLSTSHVMPYVGRYENFVREVHGMECFPAYTLISTSQGQRQISELRVGDQVWAFDASEDKGRGGLVLKRIKRLYHNTTTEWVKLSWFENGEQKELISTPGHHFLDEYGAFPTIDEMIQQGKATVVLASGEVTEVIAERIIYSIETAHLFEQAQSVGMVAGNTALAPSFEDAWTTYNFEVKDFHTYIAEGVRVHNQSGPIGQLGDSLDTGLDRLSGVRDGDGSFLDKASDLINAGMHVVDRAMKNVSAGFSNIGNSIAAGVTGVAASIIFCFSGVSFAQTISDDTRVIITDQERQISMVCGKIHSRIRCGMRPHFDGEEGYRRCNDNVAEIIHENGIVSKLEFNLRFGNFDDFYKNHTPVGLSCIKTENFEYFIAIETSIGFCGGKCTGGDFFDSVGNRVEIDLTDKDLVRGNSIYIEEGYDHEPGKFDILRGGL